MRKKKDAINKGIWAFSFLKIHAELLEAKNYCHY